MFEIGPTARPRRRRLRLPGFDYAQPSWYFVTLCTKDRVCLLGEVRDGRVSLSPTGSIVGQAWVQMPEHNPGMTIDDFVMMPNHLHALVLLEEGASPLPDIMRRFKSFTTNAVNRTIYPPPGHLWQRSYHEHIVRHERRLDRIREYIAINPLKWDADRENPNRRRVTAV